MDRAPSEEAHDTGHDVHFLSRLDRVEAAQTDLALRLYRSPDLVRRLFADPACPPDAPRLAVPIEAGDAPPHVIIARDGAFVTCLGPEMKLHEVPPLAFERVTVHLRREEIARQQKARVDEVLEVSSANDLLGRVLDAGPGLTREEFLELAALSPILHAHYVVNYEKTWNRLREADHIVARMKLPLRALEVPVVRGYWRFYHALGHLLLLIGVPGKAGFADAEEWLADEGAYALYLNAARVGYLPNALRAFWTLARAGKLALPELKRLLDASPTIRTWLPTAIALMCVGARHRGLRAEALGLVNPSRLPDHPSTTEEVRVAIKAFSAWMGELIAQAPDDPAELPAFVTDLNHGYFGEANAAEEGRTRPDLVIARIANQGLSYFSDVVGMTKAMGMGSLLCRVAPEQFYYPAADIQLARRYSPEATLDLPCFYRAPAPVVAKPKQGRNDPCACGSGKKHKKCCEGRA